MAEAVYAMCALTSLVCALLLIRAYRQRKMRFLMWSALGFVGLCLNNVVLFVDLVLLPDYDLSIARLMAALGGASLLLFGLIWRSG